MSKPEILRRCPACGASFRTSALFCPQCGSAAARATPDVPNGGEENSMNAENSQETKIGARAHREISDVDQPHGRPSSAQKAMQPNRNAEAGGDQRPKSPARGALDHKGTRRVDKIRQASNVVLDEAAYDTGLRFILVVGVLFVLFLLLLVLSKWLG